jgi:cell division protein FtsI (penicillin-binding protein 3)
VILIACLALLGAVAARSVDLQVLQHARFAAKAAAEHREEIVLHATRGDIVDRRGRPFAVSEQATTIGAYVPMSDANAQRAATAIAVALHVDRATLYDRLLGPSRAHIDLVRQADPAIARKLQAENLVGVTYVPEERRVYTAQVGTQLIGTTNIDSLGIAGLEQVYQPVLQGVDGREMFTKDTQGDPISPVTLQQPRNGKRLMLTLDTDVQAAAEHTANDVVRRTGAKSAVAIVLDPYTGGVLGMASSPGPGHTTYGAASPAQTRIRAISDEYEPGSTFKVVTIAAALARGVITPQTKFVVPYQIQRYDRKVHDAESHGTEVLTVADILRVSSNVGTVEIALQKLSGAGEADKGKYLAPYITQFGFGARTGIDLPGESPGFVLPYSKWSGVSIMNIPFGQGVATTPLQVASLYATIANGGIARQPHLASSIEGQAIAPRGHRVIPRKVARTLAHLLQSVVTPDGTGELAKIPGYTVAGKTGTTQKLVNGKYSSSHFIGWFVGFAPATSPKVVSLVMVDDPKRGYDGTAGAYYGGKTAAPAWAELTGRALGILGVPKAR